MITKVLRNYTIQKNLSRNYRESSSLKPDLYAIKSVALLLDGNKVSHSDIHKAREVLSQLGWEVSSLIFSDKVQDSIKSASQFTEKNFRFGSQLRKEVLDSTVIKQPYDMLVCFNPNGNPFVHLILTQIKAGLRLGCEPNQAQLYEIVVNIGNDRNLVRFVQHSILLLQNLNKNESSK